MIYDDPSMTQLGPGGSTVLPPAMPLHHLGPLGEGTTMTTRAPLPAEEIRIYLEHKLRELERTDSALSGRSVSQSQYHTFTKVKQGLISVISLFTPFCNLLLLIA